MEEHPSPFRVRGNLPAYCRVLMFALLFCAFACVPVPPVAYGQAFAMVNPTGAILKEQYKTWSLFLVCNPDWLSTDKSKDLAARKFQIRRRTWAHRHPGVRIRAAYPAR